MKKEKNYYLGLDIGTDSVGYAVTDEQYNLIKFHGEPAWGSMIFDAGQLKADRRSFRSARRRLDRRQQRVKLVQDIFAKEIAKVDERFFIRLQESYKWREDTQDQFVFFNDAEYTDIQYGGEYPTIHHLITALMNDKEAHDVRLVYLACAWLVAHRGHFLSNVDMKNIDQIKDIRTAYNGFVQFCNDRGYQNPFSNIEPDKLAKAMIDKSGVNKKRSALIEVLLDGNKPSKDITEEFPYNIDTIIRLLAGGTCKLKDIFGKDEYDEFGSITLGQDEDKYAELMGNIGADYDLISALRGIYDWSVLADTLGDAVSISEAKVAVYNRHKEDLAFLKYFIKKYRKEKYYEVFRAIKPDNYVAYSYHTKGLDQRQQAELKGKADVESFSKYLLKLVKDIQPDEIDQEKYDDMLTRLELREFLPKQKNTDNRVIPNQLYLYELIRILDNASEYLPFLLEKEDGVSNKEKLVSIFRYKLPYFVGPLNQHSDFSWINRKEGPILPWNYKEQIDFDASEEAFISRMTNSCTYLPGESVLPKDSLCYQKFMVLNEINNLKINGVKIPVEVKKALYHELFEKKKKVRRKDITEFLISNNMVEKGQEETVSGIDQEIKSNLSSYCSFRRLLENQILSEEDVERIIERASYAEDKTRVAKWLVKNYPSLSEEDRKYIVSIKIKDFGRLSRAFLTELEGVDPETGEVTSILQMMWETNHNLMELLSQEFSFSEEVQRRREEYYGTAKKTLEERLDDMYVSNAVRRPIYRTLDIAKDINKAFGAPKKIFIEMTRDADPDKKGKRTSTRRQQIEANYAKCREEDVRDLKKELEKLGERVDNKLQGDRLYLYFMQFGRCAYSGEAIDLEKLMAGSKEYDVDHIYPQAYVKDDSIINNKVLVLSKLNGAKKDIYPINSSIRHQMKPIWDHWEKIGAISEEKYKRLIRSTEFSEEEKYGFINRQLTETSQSTKAVAELLKEKFPDAEIVYTKARLTSEFRKEFELPKSRTYNDLHHAVDAYLNIVTGNVYHMKFSKQWFKVQSNYSIKTKTLFTHPVTCGNSMIWDGQNMLDKVICIARKNNAHFTKYAFFKKGGLFKQLPVKKAEGLVPLKKGMPTEKYGGYNSVNIMFFIPTYYKTEKKEDIIIMPVDIMQGKKFLEDESYAKNYALDRIYSILGKRVETVSFPLGMRPWKINTVLSLDGFRVCITGNASKGTRLIAQPIVQFSSPSFWKYYIRKLERFTEKIKATSNYIYDQDYDIVNSDKNLELYDLYIDKLENSIYKKRINSPLQNLTTGRDKFVALDIKVQCQVLLNIHSVFGRMTVGCDLTLIGGSKNSAATKVLNSSVSNWKKNYKDVRIIDQSASGLWEKQSQNLLELV